MSLKDRKARDLRSRESLILSAARTMLLQDGYLGLSMERLAAAVEYSKPTLYTHFETKEDLIMAVALEGLRKRVELFGRAAQFKGNSRERMCALGLADEIFVHNYPDHYQLEQLLKLPSIWEKASDSRRADLNSLDQLCFGIMHGIIGQAIADGDFDPRRHRPEDIGEGLRAISAGTHFYASASARKGQPLEAIYARNRRNGHALLDGAGWKPFVRDHDYDAAYQRMVTEVFAAEWEAMPYAPKLNPE